jgi:integrase
MRVRPADPRVDPARGPVERRAIPPVEIHAFMAAVKPEYLAACWASVLTGRRPGKLFAMDDDHLDRAREMIYMHQTVDRYGHLMNGLKGTHHIADEAKRGRWTLFPHPLIELLALRRSTDTLYLFPSPRGKFWSVRNFYRNVWKPAQADAGVAFTLYDLRHTFSSRLLAAGIPLVEVSAWMGHSLRAGGHEIVNTTTRVYARDMRVARGRVEGAVRIDGQALHVKLVRTSASARARRADGARCRERAAEEADVEVRARERVGGRRTQSDHV